MTKPGVPKLDFLVPGRLDQITGGYLFDRRIVEGLRARGVTTSWDFGWNPPLRAAAGFGALLRAPDFIFVNEAEAAMYARSRGSAAAIGYWRRAARNTVIKLGSRGSRWIAGDQVDRDVAAPAPRVRAVDTTGAGDVFRGGFIYALVNGQPIAEALRTANAAAAVSCTRLGALGGVPTLDEVRELVASGKVRV